MRAPAEIASATILSPGKAFLSRLSFLAAAHRLREINARIQSANKITPKSLSPRATVEMLVELVRAGLVTALDDQQRLGGAAPAGLVDPLEEAALVRIQLHVSSVQWTPIAQLSDDIATKVANRTSAGPMFGCVSNFPEDAGSLTGRHSGPFRGRQF
jgi:hypothetical protein